MTARIGIAGCGFIGTVHSHVLARVAKAGLVDAVVTATHDVDETRAAKVASQHGAEAYKDLDSFLDAVDAVWVCTWTAAHEPVVAAAVARGLAVFCEKPLAPTFDGCKRVAGLLASVPHQVGLVLRYAPVFRAAAEAVASGQYGRVLACVMRDDQYFPTQGQYGSDWRSDVAKSGGGTLLEHSIHDVDVLSWILGAPTSVRAEVSNRFGYLGIDDVAVLTLGYPEGVHATLLSVWHQVLTRESSRRLEIFCEQAFIWADDDYLGPLHVETSDGASMIAAELPTWAAQLGVPPEHAASVAQYAEPSIAFLRALAAKGSAATGSPDALTALHAHRIVDAAYRSAATGGASVPIVD
ncbi:MAG: Gfo/Idh/MocA family oxidoreductase [Acidimicrobiia bacterium]|nr:Gfo/Idh/MocA family oxidoreductase [Acidimicrobiia bacterium]